MAEQQFTYALVVAMFLVVVGHVNCDLLPGFKRCDNTGAIVESFAVKNCPKGPTIDEPCKLKWGRPLNLELNFTSPRDFDQALMHFHFKYDGFSLNACSLSPKKPGLKCPGKEGERLTLAKRVHLEEIIGSAQEWGDSLKFFLTDGKTLEPIVCIEFPVYVRPLDTYYWKPEFANGGLRGN